MKKLKIAGFTALTLLGSLATSQAQAVTDAVGYVSTTLVKESFNLVGITLHEATEVSGALETVSGQALTDTDIDFSALLAANTTYILEITSGDAEGRIQEITSTDVSTNVITTPDDLTMIGTGENIAAGATYKIRKAATISSIFGATNSAGLHPATAIGDADVIWVQNGGGGYDQYFYHAGGGFPVPVAAGWKNSSIQDASNTPLIYTDGLVIQTRNTLDNTITLTGSVVDTSKKIEVTTGFNLLGTVFPVGTTLGASNLETQLTQATQISAADVIWMSDGAGGYSKFFYHSGGGFPIAVTAGWKNTSIQDASSQPIDGAIFIERQSAAGATTITTTPSF